ncbi:CRISPR-associated endonuclease Cas1 [candidate division KSB1 bacterium]|nr:CRISPR-associated endonuclease Cas1 [candidate division KSB1 bacterium]
MQLILNTYGAYLYKSGNLFAIKVGDEKKQISPKKVQSIVITTAATISTDAIQLAVEHNIDILLLDKFGNPYGRVWHGRLGSTARIRRKQLEISTTEAGFGLGKDFIIRKLDNQINYLTTMRARRTKLSAEITITINVLVTAKDKIKSLRGTADELRGNIMALEGQAGKEYWSLVSLFLPDRFKFAGRSRNPARDEFNCLLNYAYGVLYGLVERACVLAGLDPYVGFIHTDHYAKTSLVFDIIEAYRIWAEETVINLFARKKINRRLFDALHNGLTLNKDGKVVLMTEFNEYLDATIRYSGRNIKRRDTTQADLHKLAGGLNPNRKNKDHANIVHEMVI